MAALNENTGPKDESQEACTWRTKAKSILSALWKFIKKWWLPLNFLVAVLVAMLAPAPGKAVVSVEAGPFRLVEMINIIIVFFISGLTLNTDEIGKAKKYWKGVLWGFVSILLITPCLGFAFTAINFTPPEFGAGLAIFSAAPTTLGVGAALVRSCKGNDSLATLLMTGTSLLSVFTIPVWLKGLVGSGGISSDGSGYSLQFNIGQMFWQLIVTLLVPSLIGKAARELWTPARNFAKKYKEYLGMFAVSNLAFIVWQSLSGAQEILVDQRFVNIIYVIIAAIIQHLIYLVFNAVVLRFIFRMPIEEAVAVWVMASQKSAPVAVTVITYITQVVATQGLLSVPCIIGQLSQIFIGSAFAPFVAKKVVKIKAARETLPSVVAVPTDGVGGVAPLENKSSKSLEHEENSTKSAELESVEAAK